MRPEGLILVALGLLAARPSAARPQQTASQVAEAPGLGPHCEEARNWLHGGREALDLERWTTSTVTYGLTLDRRWLSLPDAATRARLWALLAADPAWRVGEEHGVLVALRRVAVDGAWTTPRHGVHVMEAGGWRVAFRGGPWPEDCPWASAPGVARAGADSGRVALPAWVIPMDPWSGARASALSIDAHGLGLDIFEVAPEEARTLTVDGLRRASLTVDHVLDGRDDAGRHAGEEAGMRLLAPASGGVDVRAWIPARHPGWSWVRLVTDEGTWEEAVVGAGTRERVGHGPEGVWYLQGRLELPEGPTFPATAEVWLAADGRQRPERILSVPVRVPARGGEGVPPEPAISPSSTGP